MSEPLGVDSSILKVVGKVVIRRHGEVVVVGRISDVVHWSVGVFVVVALERLSRMLPNPLTIFRSAAMQIVRVAILLVVVVVSDMVGGVGYGVDVRLRPRQGCHDDGGGDKDVTLKIHFGVAGVERTDSLSSTSERFIYASAFVPEK